MKKFLCVLMAMLLCLPAALAETTSVRVSVTDGEGRLVLAYAPVDVADVDGDGLLTIHDALSCAHAACHPDGTDAYLAERTEFGMSMYCLWGVDNGGSYGYCVNDASAMSLLDEVHAGDHIKAYAFTDLTAWSDAYSFFQVPEMTIQAGQTAAFVLSANGYDANWAPIVTPVGSAALTIDGESTDALTDADGIAMLTFAESGVYTVSAVSEDMTLVAPVCIVTVE